MHGQRLLERIRCHQPDQAQSPPEPSGVLASVISHLGHLLNVRAGSCLARPDFGMPDFNDLVLEFPSALPVIARAIRRQIELFEPRLLHPRVRHIPDPDNPLRISFHIRARMELADGNHEAAFEILLGDDGRVRVRN